MFKRILSMVVVLAILPIGAVWAAPAEVFDISLGDVHITAANSGAVIIGESDVNRVLIDTADGAVSVTLDNVRSAGVANNNNWLCNEPISLSLVGRNTLGGIVNDSFGTLTITGSQEASLKASHVFSGGNLEISDISVAIEDVRDIDNTPWVVAALRGRSVEIRNSEKFSIIGADSNNSAGWGILAHALTISDVKDFSVTGGDSTDFHGGTAINSWELQVANIGTFVINGGNHVGNVTGRDGGTAIAIQEGNSRIHANDIEIIGGSAHIGRQGGGLLASGNLEIDAQRLIIEGGKLTTDMWNTSNRAIHDAIAIQGGDLDIRADCINITGHNGASGVYSENGDISIVAREVTVIGGNSRELRGGAGILASAGNSTIMIAAESLTVVAGNSKNSNGGTAISSWGTVDIDAEHLVVNGGVAERLDNWFSVWGGQGIFGRDGVNITGLGCESVVTSAEEGVGTVSADVNISGAAHGGVARLAINSPTAILAGLGDVTLSDVDVIVSNYAFDSDPIAILAGIVSIDERSTLHLLYPTRITGNVANHGVIATSSFLGIDGDYHSVGGSFHLLVNSPTPASFVVINGEVTGVTDVSVTRASGAVAGRVPLILSFNDWASGDEFRLVSLSSRFEFEQSAFLSNSDSVWFYNIAASSAGNTGSSGGGGGGGGSQPTVTPTPTMVPTPTPTPTPSWVDFERLMDVQPSDWFYDDVKFVVENELFMGIEEDVFAPQMNMTRAMIITVLARYAGIDTSGGDEWYSVAVEWGKANGLTDGESLMGNVTREQLATLLHRLAGEPETATGSWNFTDTEEISDFATAAIIWAVNSGIMNGYDDGRLDPLGSATRAQVAAMVHRFARMN